MSFSCPAAALVCLACLLLVAYRLRPRAGAPGVSLLVPPPQDYAPPTVADLSGLLSVPADTPIHKTADGTFFLVRGAGADDVPGLVALERSSGMRDLYRPRDFRRLVAYPEAMLWVAARVPGGTPLGYLSALDNGRQGHLVSCVVAPGQRHKGVGSALVARAGAFRPWRKLVAVARESDLAAQLFLKSLGFGCVGIRHDLSYAGGPESGYVFTRALPRQGP